MVKQAVSVVLRAVGVGLSAFLKSLHEQTHPSAVDPRHPAAVAFFRTFTAAAKNVNAVCLRCGGRIHGRDACWVRPDEQGPTPKHYRYICEPCHGNVNGSQDVAR